MSLKVFLLGLIAAYASDFLTLVTDIDGVQTDSEFTCDGDPGSFGSIPLAVNGLVSGYHVAEYCDSYHLRFGGATPAFRRRFATFDGFLLYVCARDHTRESVTDELCGFHDKGTEHSLHVAYKGAKMGDKVVLGKDQIIEHGFLDIYDGNEMSYGNFVAVFLPDVINNDRWTFAVGETTSTYSVRDLRGTPGEELIPDTADNLRSCLYPAIPDSSKTNTNPLVLSVGVFGTIRSHHYVHSCMKDKPDGHCIHSNSSTFTKVGSDLLTMALPSDMETYYFEYTVFKFSEDPTVYNRVIFKTSVVKNSMIDSFQKKVFFASEEGVDTFVATNLMRCQGTYDTCMDGQKKSLKLTFFGYTELEDVQKLMLQGGDIVIQSSNVECQGGRSQCVARVEFFTQRNTQVWHKEMLGSCSMAVKPDVVYEHMICLDLTVVIEAEVETHSGIGE